jgi:2-oxoisovalerate dehydrogenase E1 component
LNTKQIHVPQLGEGVREARIIALLKSSGDRVGRDEPLLEVETDKALYVVESPSEGVVGPWQCAEGSVLPVGTLLVEIRPLEISRLAASTDAPRNGRVPPRLREYARQNGIGLEDLPPLLEQKHPNGFTPLADRLAIAHASTVPATIQTSFLWDGLDFARRRRRAAGSLVPSSVEWIAWNVCTSLDRHPRMRALFDERHLVRSQKHVHLGIAVELPDDELGVAVIQNATQLQEESFFMEMRRAISAIKSGERAGPSPQLVVSSLAHLGIESAIPVVVPPSLGTLFVGSPSPSMGMSGAMERRSCLALTFDHRALNGAAAARFLRDVVSGIESLRSTGT